MEPPELIPLRVLIVEDQPADAALVVRALREAGYAPDWQRVETESAYLALLEPPPDIILSDYALPHFSGMQALRLLRAQSLSIPFILITGAVGEEAAVNALQEGADDYLLKDRLARLGRAVKRALEQRALRKEKQQAVSALWDSEQRLLREERAARAEAEAAVRMRDEFLSIASHELRTPVTAIKCTAQLLLSRFDRGDVSAMEVITRLRTVNAMSDRLSVLIADLLDVSRLRTGRLELRPEPIDLARLAKFVVDEQQVQLGSQYPLKFSVLGVMPSISADPQRLQQVLSNLLENAVKYSPAGGDVEVTLTSENLGVLVSVSDRGIGLPTEAAETIFEPFGRASNAQQQQLPGMGLGLYIARQIVEQHGGRIWAESAGEGLGTRVNVWLPGAAVAAAA